MVDFTWRAYLPLSLGNVVITRGAQELLSSAGVSPLTLLVRHAGGNFGDLHADDQRANEDAIVHGGRVLSVYTVGLDDQPVWVITEADRSLTTILLPSEY